MILFPYSTSAPHSGQEGEVVSNETPWPKRYTNPNTSSDSGSYQHYWVLIHNMFGQIYRVIAGEANSPRPFGGLGQRPAAHTRVSWRADPAAAGPGRSSHLQEGSCS